MSFNPTPTGAVVTINVRLCLTFLLGTGAYWAWPSSARYWDFAILSIFLGVIALASLLKAIKLMVQLRSRAIAVGGYLARYRAPRPDRLAGSDDLKRAGMKL